MKVTTNRTTIDSERPTMPKPLLKKKIRNRTVPSRSDVYIREFSVYRVHTYNETEDTVLLATTNDNITTFGNIKRIEMRKNDYYSCPYQLLHPAIQVFELDEKFSNKSLEELKRYRSQYVRLYDRLGLFDLFNEVENVSTRVYKIPEEQGQQFPTLAGKSFDVLIPFLCVSKNLYKQRYRTLDITPGKEYSEEYYRAMRYQGWPIFYIPSRFE